MRRVNRRYDIIFLIDLWKGELTIFINQSLFNLSRENTIALADRLAGYALFIIDSNSISFNIL